MRLFRQRSTAEGAPENQGSLLVIIAALACFLTGAVLWIYLGESWLDEGKYLIKGYWHVRGQLQLYGPEDSSDYMPLAFIVPGYWQAIVGPGPLAVRALSSLCGLGVLALLAVVARRVVPARFVGPTLLIVALTPMVYPFFCSITCYTWASGASLLAFWLILSDVARPRAWKCLAIGAAYYVMYFTRVNMIFGIALLMLFHGVSAGSHRIRRIGLSVAAAVALSVSTLLCYPSRIWYVALEFPGLSPILRRAGVLPDQFPLVERFTEHVGLGWTWSQARLAGSARALVSGFLIHYPITTFLCLIASATGIRRGRWRDPGVFCACYFLIMALVHFLGSQSYCPRCVMCYTNYFLVFGAIGSGYAMVLLAEKLGSLSGFRRAATQASLFAGVTASAAVMAWAFVTGGDLRSRGHFMPLLPDATRWVSQNIPEGKRVLLMSASPLMVEAAFMAGHRFEPTCINQHHSWVKLAPSVDPSIRDQVLDQVSAVSLWTDELMQRWLDSKYDYVLWQADPSPGPWSDLLKRNFVKVSEYRVPERGDVAQIWRRSNL